MNPTSFEDRFHWLLGRLVRATAAFDFNVGLQLNWMGQYYGRDFRKLLQPRQARLGDRLTALQELVEEVFAPAGDSALGEFRRWFEEANHSRGLRNEYSHGRWATPGAPRLDAEGRSVEGDWLLVFVPLDFDMTTGRADISVAMTLEQFEVEVQQAERLAVDYFKLSEQYREHMMMPGNVSPGR